MLLLLAAAFILGSAGKTQAKANPTPEVTAEETAEAVLEATPTKTSKAAVPAKKTSAKKASKKVDLKTVDRVGLIVNRESVTVGEIEEAVVSEYLQSGRRPPSSPSDPEYLKVRKSVVEGMTQEMILSQQAAAMTVEVSDKEVEKQAQAEVDSIKKRFPDPKEFEQGLAAEGLTEDQFSEDLQYKLKRQILAARVLRQKQQEMPASLLTDDEEVKKAYQGHERDYDQVKFSMIEFRIPEDKRKSTEYAVALEKQTSEVLKELKGGADFAAYARKYSEDPASAEKGGDIGTLYRSELPSDMARGVFNIPAKGLGIVKTSKAMYVVKVFSKKISTYETALVQIRERLRRDSTEKAMRKWIDELKAQAYIKEIK